MAKNIGSFGSKREAVDLEFGYFGSTVRVHPDASDLSYMDFMQKAVDIDETDEVTGFHAVMDFLKGQIHPDDWDNFWKLARTNRQTTTDLMEVSSGIVQAVARFPTLPSADSSHGQLNTTPKSKDDLSSQVNQILKGRPDLQMAVAHAQAARASST